MSRYSTALVVVVFTAACSPSGLKSREPSIQVAAPATPFDPTEVQPDVEEPPPAPESPESPETEPDPPEEEPPEDTNDPPTPPPPPPPPPSSTDACYPGPNMTWDVCLPTVIATGLGSDYAYPAPMGGSPQYRAPTRYLDLAGLDGATQLAPNFRLDEVAQEYKGQYAVVQPHAIDRLQDLRDDLGALVVNSGYRPPAYNASIGGATYSRHMYGDAFDLSPNAVSLSTLQSACNTHGAGYVGVYATHMHCDWRDDTVSVEFFGSANGTFSYDPPLFDAHVRFDGIELDAPAEGWDEGEPLREWTAYDADGWAIGTGVGEKYVPPSHAASVEVWIGREIVRTVIF